jgi:ATP-dependent DNA ligase
MALSTIADYQSECLRLGLSVLGSGKNGKVMKMDYIHALEHHYLEGYRSQGLATPGMEWTVANLESPQLAQSQSAFRDEVQFQSVVGSENRIAEIKQDGARIICVYTPSFGFEFFSRNRSEADQMFCMYTDQIYGLDRRTTESLGLPSFVLDGEMISINPSINGKVVTDTVLAAVVAMLSTNQLDSYRMQAEAGYPLRYQVFDILMYDGKSVMEEPLHTRKKLLHEVLTALHKLEHLPQLGWLNEVSWVEGDFVAKKAYFEEVVNAGGEGLVIKDMNAPYNPREARGGQGAPFLKWKRTISHTMGSEIDAYVSGFTPGTGNFEGLVGSLDFSVYLLPSMESHIIARISGIDEATRRACTVKNGDGSVGLNPEWLGRVAAIDGQDISSRSRAFSHARLLRWRSGADAKYPSQCTVEESVLNNMVL